MKLLLIVKLGEGEARIGIRPRNDEKNEKKKRNVGKKERKFVVIKWVDGKRFEAFWNRYFCGVLYNIL